MNISPHAPRRGSDELRAIRKLTQHCRGAAIIETALLLPLFLALLMGIMVYGLYFQIAHNVQQAANDGARAAIAGIDAADRRDIATKAVDRSLHAISSAAPQHRSITVAETPAAITISVAYTVPEDSFLRSTFVPTPGNIIRAQATFELQKD